MAYYALKKDVFDINKVTVVGNPTITSDGVASGFSLENYINVPVIFDATKDFNINLKFRLNSYVSHASNLFWVATNTYGGYFGFLIAINSSGYIYDSGFTATDKTHKKIELNVENDLNIKKQDGLFYIYLNGDLLRSDVFSKNIPTAYMTLGGKTTSSNLETGSINLPSFKIYGDNQLVYTPTKPTYLLERRKEGYDPSKFTIVGSPTITEYGVLTNCPTQNDYLMKEIPSLSQFDEVEIRFSFKVNSIPTSSRGIFNLPNDENVLTANNGTYAWLGANGYFGINLAYNNPITSGDNGTATAGKYKVEVGDTVKVIAKAKKGEAGNIQISKNNASFEEPIYTITSPCNFLETTKLYLGMTGSGRQMQNYMDIYLTDFTIIGDGKEVFTGSKYVYYALSNKPSYIPLDYIEATGTQWIDTGIAFQPIKAVIELCFNEDVKTRQVMGFSSYNTTYFGKTSIGVFELGGGITLNNTINPYEWHTVEFTHNGIRNNGICTLTVDGKTITRQNSITNQPSNFWLFNVPGYGTTLACHCKIRSAKYYNPDTNELISDFIPVLDKDLEPCTYDKVNNKYHYNGGTGQFIGG